MTNRITIAVLGGSSSSTPDLVAALIDAAAHLPTLTLALAGRSSARLEQVAGLARRLIRSAGLDWQVTTTTEQARAISRADFVINQVRVGGLRARDYDETFPLEYGIPGDETAGPGGLANALRSLPVYLETARVIERESPDAILLQLSNPANAAISLIHQHTRVRAIGFCDQPVALVERIAGLLDVAPGRLHIDYGGLNHLGFALRVTLEGRDVTGDVINGITDTSFGVEPELIKALGVIPTSYLRIVYHPDRVVDEQRARSRSRAQDLMEIERQLYESYADSALVERPALLDKRGASRWYRGALLPLLLALTGSQPADLILIAQNGHALPDLPPSATVEISTHVSGPSVQVRPLGSLPPAIRGLIQAAIAHEELTIRAALEPSEENILAALIADPLVPNYAVAAGLVGRMRGDGVTR
jgi:6-phospho-beta-glucosidase